MGFWTLIGMGWRGAFVAIRRQWLLFLVIAIAMVAWKLIIDKAYFHPSGEHLLDGDTMIQDAVSYIIGTVLAVPCFLAVHRSVLLNDNGASWKNWQRSLLFAGALLAVYLIANFPSWILALVATPVPRGSLNVAELLILALISVVFSIWFFSRIPLIYPAIALDLPNPFREGWARSRHHAWSIFWSVFFALLPIALLQILIVHLLHRFQPDMTAAWGLIAMSGIITLLFQAVLSGVISQLFSKFGGVP